MRIWRIAGLGWLLFLSAAYFWPSDALYAITIWPPFVWAGLGFVLSLLGIRKRRNRLQIALLASWIGFWVAFGEEKYWLVDRLQSPGKPDLVLVTLNCAGGMAEAAEEAFAHNPDLILFQESPPEKELRQLAEKHFGKEYGLVWGVDASIICRDKAIQAGIKTMAFSEARMQTAIGPIRVISLRLSPPVFRLDYWNPECWRDYARNRQSHREELAEVNEVASQDKDAVTLIGGDFNWTPDREMTRVLPDFNPVSHGSGYSAVNDYPLARIDQVWATKGFKGIAEAITTKNSDHRMVVVKLWRK